MAWLLVASCLFYGYWSVTYFWLLAAAMTANYLAGRLIDGAHGRARRILFIVAICGNLALLGYYKYVDFFISAFADVTGIRVALLHVFLPLGISFFTFQKIAYISDIYVGKAKSGRFLDFALFVFFFPQLIAGPIVHHRDMLPQFMQPGALTPRAQNMAIGLSIFALGLFKKTVLADGVAQYATPVFDAAAAPTA